MSIKVPNYNLVYREGDVFFVQDNTTGAIIHQGDDASAVLDCAKGSVRSIYIKKGEYPISRTLDMESDLEIYFEKGAILVVPEGFTESAIRFGNGVRFAKIDGGIVREAGNAAKQWTGIDLVSSGLGVLFNSVHHFEVWNPGTAIALRVDNGMGWVNGNDFRNLRIVHPRIFIDFDMSAPWRPSENGINRNHFQQIVGQADSATLFGARNIRHLANLFLDVKFWDLGNPDAVSASIHRDAEDTLILGGIMTNRSFDNRGARTQVIEPFAGASFADVTAWSSKKSRFDLRQVSAQEEASLLRQLMDTQVFYFRDSTSARKDRLGLLAEEAPSQLVAEGNEDALSLVDHVAMLHLAVKNLQSQISELRRAPVEG